MSDPIKDLDHEHPIARAWRPSFYAIVEAFRAGDFRLASPIPGVEAIDEATASQIEEYLEDYGETLAKLPQQSWATSVSQWNGSRWDVLVDLFTEESGSSDLVISASVVEKDEGFVVRVNLVYVP